MPWSGWIRSRTVRVAIEIEEIMFYYISNTSLFYIICSMDSFSLAFWPVSTSNLAQSFPFIFLFRRLPIILFFGCFFLSQLGHNLSWSFSFPPPLSIFMKVSLWALLDWFFLFCKNNWILIMRLNRSRVKFGSVRIQENQSDFSRSKEQLTWWVVLRNDGIWNWPNKKQKIGHLVVLAKPISSCFETWNAYYNIKRWWI